MSDTVWMTARQVLEHDKKKREMYSSLHSLLYLLEKLGLISNRSGSNAYTYADRMLVNIAKKIVRS